MSSLKYSSRHEKCGQKKLLTLAFDFCKYTNLRKCCQDGLLRNQAKLGVLLQNVATF